jgi:hypothetical protein
MHKLGSLMILIVLAILSVQHNADAQVSSLSVDPLRQGRALLIGNSVYRDRRWPQLLDIPPQLAALETGLKKHFEYVEVVQNLESEGLRQKINNFLRVHGNSSNARLFVYYAGHGYTELIEERNEYRGYITGIDTPWIDNTKQGYDAARLRAISMMEIKAPLSEILAQHVLFAFDSCFAGTIFTSRTDSAPRMLTPAVVERLLGKPSRDFLTAGSANEIVPAHSPFPELFLAALNGEADRYNHGVISAADINAYLRDKLLQSRDVTLTPQQGRLPDATFAQGEFLFRTTAVVAPPAATAVVAPSGATTVVTPPAVRTVVAPPAATVPVTPPAVRKVPKDTKPDDTVGYDYTMRPLLFLIPAGSPDTFVDGRKREAEALRGRFQGCEEGITFARALKDVAVRDQVIRSSADIPAELRKVLEGIEVGRLTPPEVTKLGVQMFAICAKKASR